MKQNVVSQIVEHFSPEGIKDKDHFVAIIRSIISITDPELKIQACLHTKPVITEAIEKTLPARKKIFDKKYDLFIRSCPGSGYEEYQYMRDLTHYFYNNIVMLDKQHIDPILDLIEGNTNDSNTAYLLEINPAVAAELIKSSNKTKNAMDLADEESSFVAHKFCVEASAFSMLATDPEEIEKGMEKLYKIAEPFFSSLAPGQ